MEAKGAGCRGLCLAVLCAGIALALKGEGLGDHNITQHSDILEETGAPTTATRDVTMGPVSSPSPSGTGNPITITVPLQAGAPGNQTRTQEPTTSISDFSDVATAENDTALTVPDAQKSADNPPPQELSKTTSCQPAPPSEQSSQQPTDPITGGSPLCSGVPVDD
ncbi:uncharacterized protein LOC121107558 isoform X3 [Gallus gallus]|uniref:uncharacterized protein LOC121107558 isoform X3 n=1 Tax=Gallus gallus TaxID=9031 RepID=UPI001AE4A376|nr:uncharacterized protein LOC121107558 isoform X3 [Gallus gallus]